MELKMTKYICFYIRLFHTFDQNLYRKTLWMASNEIEGNETKRSQLRVYWNEQKN